MPGDKMVIGNREFDLTNKMYIMGILNVTPDSFSDGGKWNNIDSALKHAEQMIADGADIIDVGGESTRPGYTLLADDKEIERVVTVIEKIRANFDTPISIDTYKYRVAEAAIESGADLVNDIWGLRADVCVQGNDEYIEIIQDDRLDKTCAKSSLYEECCAGTENKMAQLIAKKQVACCLMHNRKEPVYRNYLREVCEDLTQSVEIAKKAGIADNKIMIDPGIGFAKSYEQNLKLMNHLEILKQLKYPILLGTSRKSMIGITLDLPVTQREEGTIATTVIGKLKGCSFVRVHDVKANKRAILMTEAVLNS